jgi:hypothetical protein
LTVLGAFLDPTAPHRDRGRMPSWSTFAASAPDLAAAVRARLEARVHGTLATVRRDGGPRISGTELAVTDGELWIGSMWGARKAGDLQRDPRFALHSGSDDPPAWSGDAKVAGRARELDDPERVQALLAASDAPPGPAHVFLLDLDEVSTVEAVDGVLRITVWTPSRGVRVLERAG